MNKKILILLIPVFLVTVWFNSPTETYITYADCGHAYDGCYCGYGKMPTFLDPVLTKKYSACSVYDHFFHENHEVIDDQWRCTGEMCEELGKERYIGQ